MIKGMTNNLQITELYCTTGGLQHSTACGYLISTLLEALFAQMEVVKCF